MKGIARVGDTATGLCYHPDHNYEGGQYPLSVTGTITETSNTVVECSDGRIVAVVGDTVTFSCGHIGLIKDGTSVVSAKDIPIATEDSNVDTSAPGSSKTGYVIGKITSASSNITGS